MKDHLIVQLKKQVKNLETQLLCAQKSSALGELVGTTTHEFNNVLMTIMNYAKLGIRHTDQETRDKALTKILAASERAAKITNSVWPWPGIGAKNSKRSIWNR